MKKIKSMLYGFAVADALGIPVEFKSRKILKKNPVTSMQGFGTYNQPAGTWSDDTSMTLATMESISRLKKIDYADIMQNFSLWLEEGKFKFPKFAERRNQKQWLCNRHIGGGFVASAEH